MSAEMEALAHAWDAGFDAAAERAQRALLLAATLGVSKAVSQIKAEKPASNPYRLGKS